MEESRGGMSVEARISHLCSYANSKYILILLIFIIPMRIGTGSSCHLPSPAPALNFEKKL